MRYLRKQNGSCSQHDVPVAVGDVDGLGSSERVVLGCILWHVLVSLNWIKVFL